MSPKIPKFSPAGGGAVRYPWVCPCTRDCCGGGRHSSGGQTPILDGLLLTIFSPLPGPKPLELWEFKSLFEKSPFSATYGTFAEAGISCAGDTAAPCHNGWIPKCHRKATKRLLNNQGALGARALCCLTFLPVWHLGGREGEKYSQLSFPMPPGVPYLPWAPNECIASVPLSWFLDGASQLFRWL